MVIFRDSSIFASSIQNGITNENHTIEKNWMHNDREGQPSENYDHFGPNATVSGRSGPSESSEHSDAPLKRRMFEFAVNTPNSNDNSLPSNSILPDFTQGINWLVDRFLLIKHGEVLNAGGSLYSEPNPAQALRRAAKELTAIALDETGEHVDYNKLATSDSYARFREYTLSLPQCKLEDIGGRNDQIAFWINLYNALIIDAVIFYQVRGSILSKPSLFRRAAYDVAGTRFSADDIEHGILRGNRPHPTLLLRQFGASDPRRMMSIHPFDPRIHFALVCGAESCPPISFYQGDLLDAQLDQAAGSFINGGGASINPSDGSLLLSRILKWYQADFGGTSGVLEIVMKYSKDEFVQRASLSESLKIRYSKYDWSVNSLV
jgi:hypothetical protein